MPSSLSLREREVNTVFTGKMPILIGLHAAFGFGLGEFFDGHG